MHMWKLAPCQMFGSLGVIGAGGNGDRKVVRVGPRPCGVPSCCGRRRGEEGWECTSSKEDGRVWGGGGLGTGFSGASASARARASPYLGLLGSAGCTFQYGFQAHKGLWLAGEGGQTLALALLDTTLVSGRSGGGVLFRHRVSC